MKKTTLKTKYSQKKYYKDTVSFRLDKQLHEKISDIALKKGITVKWIVNEAVKRFLNEVK